MRLIASMMILATILVLGCGGGPALQQSAQPETLKFTDLGGAYLNYVADFGIDTNFEGSVVSWLSTINFKVKVDSITDKVAERRFEFGKFTVTTIQGERPEPDPNAPEYEGTTLWLQMDPEGGVVDWKGLDVVRGRTVDGRSLKDYIVYQLVSMFQPPPDKPVNTGSTWQDEFVVKIRTGAVDADFTTRINYTVEGFAMRKDRNCAKIKTDLMITAKGEGTIGGKETSFESEAEGQGEIWFDYVNGVMVEFNNKTTTTRQTRTERVGKEDIISEAITLDSVVKIRLAG
jgi:hypothetical protein